jgi:hypothetical protein
MKLVLLMVLDELTRWCIFLLSSLVAILWTVTPATSCSALVLVVLALEAPWLWMEAPFPEQELAASLSWRVVDLPWPPVATLFSQQQMLAQVTEEWAEISIYTLVFLLSVVQGTSRFTRAPQRRELLVISSFP